MLTDYYSMTALEESALDVSPSSGESHAGWMDIMGI